jgi:hypothetical protein
VWQLPPHTVIKTKRRVKQRLHVSRNVGDERLALLLAPGPESLSTQSNKEPKSLQICRKQHHRRQPEKNWNYWCQPVLWAEVLSELDAAGPGLSPGTNAS